MQRGRSSISVADLLSAGLLHAGQRLSFRKSDTIVAEVTPSGTLRVGSDEFSSPSTAGRAVAHGVATNGWAAWYLREPTGWSSLADLRARFRAR